MIIIFEKLHPDAKLPAKQTPGSIGYDVFAFVKQEQDRPSKLLIQPGTTRNVSTKLLVHPPPDTPLFVCSRSGMAGHSVFVANQPGIIDPDYRGELRILLHNSGWEPFWVEHEQRIAQIFAVSVAACEIVEGVVIDNTERGRKGLGSTGA